jgi:hypothetical protein
VSTVLLARVAVASVSCVPTPEVQWDPDAGGNGHFYRVNCASLDWDQAKAAAIAVGRHLVTLTTSQENAFVFDLVDDAGYWTLDSGSCNIGPWLGGFQPQGAMEPAGDWTWVTGEPFGFTAWWPPNEPNDSGGDEDFLHFFDCASAGQRSAHWNDIDVTSLAAYVTEWEHSLDVDGDGETEPLTDGLLILRHLFGFSGAILTTGATDAVHCTRCDAATIAPFIDLMKSGVVYDATADWSDAANPNGPWAYLEGANALPHIASWQSTFGGYTSPQPGWAKSENGNDRIPFFHRSLGFEDFVHDYQTGDLVVHTWDSTNGAGNSNARLRFIVPASGFYRTVLAVWMGREIGRSVSWELDVDDVAEATGSVASGDGFSRSSPDGINTSLSLSTGDEVELHLDTSSQFGDYVGIRLRFEAFSLDVDGDGETQPLTDGLLILRHLFGFNGASLTIGAVDAVNCTRCDATAIKGYLDAFD